MKNLYKLLIGVLALSTVTSCDDYLEVDHYDILPADFMFKTDFMIPFIRTSTVPVMTKHGDSSLRYLLPTILRWTVRLPVGMRNGSVMPGNPIRVPWRLHGG